ncbi:helix-turn-helix transcriptional regulator [Glycomyces sp. NPDC048151]|uniref:helix-turn-helix transcriptional regulator n=1 Tax=Glycomyces sp. NPDC048151 TaxID=3364002 RepID=UPI00371FE11D
MSEERTALVKRRTLVGHSQESLARAVGSTSRSVRNWEHGISTPSPRLRPSIARALEISLEVLDRLLNEDSQPSVPTPNHLVPIPADVHPAPELEYLFAKLISRSHQSEIPEVETTSPGSMFELPDGTPLPLDSLGTTSDLDELLLGPLASWAAADNRIGPHPLRGLVTSHFRVIESFLDSARGTDFKQVTYAAARHAELGGWLAQDAGDLPAAAAWTKSALDAARISSNRELESYILMRQSNIATDRGDAKLAIALADAAWQTARSQSEALHVLALRQRAHAHAALGDSAAALRDAERARTLLLHDSPELSDLTGYCTLEFLTMESASCLVDLGFAAEAIPILESGLQDWDPTRRRDLGLCLARLALAYAHCRETEIAMSISQQAADIAATTRSHRTLRVLQRVCDEFQRLGSLEQMRDLRTVLGT